MGTKLQGSVIELERIVDPEIVLCRLSAISIPDIVEIERDSNRPPWTAELFAGEFENQYSLQFGARKDGRLIGFLICHVIHDEAHILNFGLLPEERGHGYGKALLTYVLHELFDATVRWVTLEVRRSNGVARALYDSVGFLEVGVRERYYTDNKEDAVVLKLNLQQFADARRTFS